MSIEQINDMFTFVEGALKDRYEGLEMAAVKRLTYVPGFIVRVCIERLRYTVSWRFLDVDIDGYLKRAHGSIEGASLRLLSDMIDKIDGGWMQKLKNDV